VDAFAYDLVLLLDVIEHLADPERFLIGLRHESQTLRPGHPATKVVISTPNVAFAAIRVNLLLGRFNYAERGILDITHKRLFTWSSLLATLRDCGYRVEHTIPIGVPFEAVLPGTLGQVLGRACDLLARAWPALFAFQIMAVCEPLPGVHHVLSSTGSAGLLSVSPARSGDRQPVGQDGGHPQPAGQDDGGRPQPAGRDGGHPIDTHPPDAPGPPASVDTHPLGAG
jgi:hypothetical protein